MITSIDVAAVVVEADAVLTSQDYGYDRTLQPRQRDRAASQAQVRDVSKSIFSWLSLVGAAVLPREPTMTRMKTMRKTTTTRTTTASRP